MQYHPMDFYNANPELKEVLDQIRSGAFCPDHPDLFRPSWTICFTTTPICSSRITPPYIACQEQVGHAFLNPRQWARMSILNVARSGHFSSDRTIREYCRDIWKVSSVPISAEPDATPV